jgi:RNA-binding protein
MLKITSNERSLFRSQAHALNPVVIIGEKGLTPSIIKEIDTNLNAHELIKIRVSNDEREERIAIYNTICEKLNAAPIQHIGKLLVIYRTKISPHSPEKRNNHGLKEVTIIKPSRSGTKRPTVTKVTLKKNERVTAGGLIKKAKKRQTSTKKL